MDKLIITSMRQDVGKTSLIVGLAKALGGSIGYWKPLGDRILYRKKRLWDHDSALMTTLFDLPDDPQTMSLGFDHAKLRYMYNQASTQAKLLETVAQLSQDTTRLFIESGKDISYGISIYLDPIFVAKQVGGRLLLVLAGEPDTIIDDLVFAKKLLDSAEVDFSGVIINQLRDIDDFKQTSLPLIETLGVEVLGLLPYQAELTTLSPAYLAERLLAKVIAGAAYLPIPIQKVFVGAMSVDAALRNPAFHQKDSLMITSGDRTDMILAALESEIACIILTNNILPPASIIAKATARQVPLLVVGGDTYDTAKQIDATPPLLTVDDTAKLTLLTEMVKAQVNLAAIGVD